MSQVVVKDERTEFYLQYPWTRFGALKVGALFSVGNDKSVLRKIDMKFCEWLIDRGGVPCDAKGVVDGELFSRCLPLVDIRLELTLRSA